MRCDNCGRPVPNEEANFCEYCGSSFREQRQTPSNTISKDQSFPGSNRVMNAGMQNPGMQNPGMMNPGIPMNAPHPTTIPLSGIQDKPTSFLSWLGVYGLLLIPFVGWLAFLVILFMWAFGGNVAVSKKNWARATLVFVGVVIIVLFILLIIMMYLYMPIYQEMNTMMENGTFNYDSYMELLKKYNYIPK